MSKYLIIALLLTGCPGSPNPFFPSNDGVPHDTPVFGSHMPSDTPTFHRDPPITYDENGLQKPASLSDHPDPTIVAKYATCLAMAETCIVDHRASIQDWYDGQVNEESEAAMEAAVAGCEQCAVVCSGLVLAGYQTIWPMYIPTPNREPWRPGQRRELPQEELTQPDSDEQWERAESAQNRNRVFECTNEWGASVRASTLELALSITASKLANLQIDDWVKRLNAWSMGLSRNTLKTAPSWVRDLY